MYCYDGEVTYKKVWYGVRAEFDIAPGEKANFSGRPDSWYPGTDPELSFNEVNIEDEDGNPVDLGYQFEVELAKELLGLVDGEDECIHIGISMN